MKMKPVIFILALILSNVLMAQDQKIKWYSFEEAVALNKENPKKLFIDLYTDWCGWCKRMDQTTFKNAEIVKFMNDNYYPVKFNAETTDTLTFKGQVYTNPFPMKKRSTHKLAVAMLGQRISYPSYAFLDGGSNMITGGWPFDGSVKCFQCISDRDANKRACFFLAWAKSTIIS
jgi:thioredoxin-related protein